jgi:hypothetical protein
MELFTTTLDLYGGVLWSGELQGFIIHERVPIANSQRYWGHIGASQLSVAGAKTKTRRAAAAKPD